MSKPLTPEQIARSGTEHSEQAALFAHAAIMARTDYRWDKLFAVPNAGKRTRAHGAWMKAEGLRTGFPDTGLAVPRYGLVQGCGARAVWRHGLFIELKRIGDISKPAGKLNDAQELWRDRLIAEGYSYGCCFGWQQAAEVISRYLDLSTAF